MDRGLVAGECGMRWNEDKAEAVRSVHEAYAAAGCRLITTNSFGGTRTMLERHGQDSKVADWNRLAAALAREAAGPSNWVFGDVGPFGDFLEPVGEVTTEELTGIFSEQIAALSEGGIDAVLVETMSDPHEAAVAVRAAGQVCKLPVAVTYAFQKTAGGFRTMMGNAVREAVGEVLEAGASLVGAICGTDLSLEDYALLADELVAAAAGTPVILQANAGAPKTGQEGKISYDASPVEMAEAAIRFQAAGVRVIGGCCGTTPAHLAAMANALGLRP